MTLVELQLGRVLDGDDAVSLRDKARQHVEERGFTGPGAAGDDDVQFGDDTRLQQICHLLGKGAELDQIFNLERDLRELADGDGRPVDGARRDDGIDPGPIGQARVYHRPIVVDATAQGLDDAIDDPQHVIVICKFGVGFNGFAVLLHIDQARSIHHDLCHLFVVQQRFQRTKAQDFIRDGIEESCFHPLWHLQFEVPAKRVEAPVDQLKHFLGSVLENIRL